METRLIAVDLDGTLLRTDRTLSPATIEAVAAAAERGLEVVIASGRTLSETRHLLAQLPQVHYLVGNTGAFVLDLRTNTYLHFSPVPLSLIQEAWRQLRQEDILFEVNCGGEIYIPTDRLAEVPRFEDACGNHTLHETRRGGDDYDQWLETLQEPVTKLHLYFPTGEARDAAQVRLGKLKGVDLCTSDPVDLDMTAHGIHKGVGVARLAEHLGLSREQVMAIGDSGNDLGMLRYAGTAVVMANGSDEAKALAHRLTDTNDNDGVAKVLNSLHGVERL